MQQTGKVSHIIQRWDMPIVQKSLDYAIAVTELTKRIATDKMVAHKFIDDEMNVQETAFESGVRVTANLNNKAADSGEGFEMPPLSWREL